MPEAVFAMTDPEALVDKLFWESMPIIVNRAARGKEYGVALLEPAGRIVSQEIRLPSKRDAPSR
ncbi:MAG: hypothetical protein V8Q84_04515 [Bilophila sp.]